MPKVVDFTLLAVGGVLLGATGVVVQAGRGTALGYTVPWGIPVVLIAVLAAVRGAVWWRGSRYAGAAVAAGWFVGTLLVTQLSPGGDVLLTESDRNRNFLLACALVAGLAAAVPLPSDHVLGGDGGLGQGR